MKRTVQSVLGEKNLQKNRLDESMNRIKIMVSYFIRAHISYRDCTQTKALQTFETDFGNHIIMRI